MDSDDVALIASAVEGDMEAVSILLRTYGPRVREKLHIGPTCRGLLDAEDVMQVTYLEAFLRIGQLDSRNADGFAAWLGRMAQNNLRDAIKELRRAKRPDPVRRMQPRTLDESVSTLLEAVGVTLTTPSRQAAMIEARSHLEAALVRLPNSYRRVVELYDLGGQPIEQVASALGRSAGAVYMLRARALDCLRESLGSRSRFFTDSA